MFSDHNSDRKLKTRSLHTELELCEEADKAILIHILSPEIVSFRRICNSERKLFGTPNSKLRRSVQNRRTYLSRLQTKDPEKFSQVCRRLSVSVCADSTPSKQQGIGESQNNINSPKTTTFHLPSSPVFSPVFSSTMTSARRDLVAHFLACKCITVLLYFRKH